MQIRVDRSRCQGHAQCWVANEDLFPLDDVGYSVADGIAVPGGLEDDAHAGAALCPEHAISLDV